MVIKTKRLALALMFLALLFIFLSGCAKIYFYKLSKDVVQYEFGNLLIEISDIGRDILKGKTIQYYEDSVYSDRDRRALRYKDIPYDSSKYVYLGVINTTYCKIWETVVRTYFVADSIKIIPKPQFEFPEYDGLDQITVWEGVTSSEMWINPILVPKDYKDDFVIEYVLSIYKKGDSTLLVRKPIKLKVEYKSHTYSPFIQGT
ncbi:MAG: hypothetical protein IIC66_09295 [candidate division Zixibacteria bacterium]|nr:hypothetical protein [candidate division Zixibacteria bacterium]